MLNEQKIRLMTRAAIYETHEGKKTIPVNQYFRGDYVSINLIRSLLSYTLVYALCVALWVIYKLDYLLENFHKMDLPALGKQFLTIYGVGLAVYLVLVGIYYVWKYRKSRKSLGRYYQILKRISAFYRAEEKAKKRNNTQGGNVHHDDITGI